jgi:hypothetical protein
VRRLERERFQLEEGQRLVPEAAKQQVAANAAVQGEQDARLAKENALIARIVDDEATRKADATGSTPIARRDRLNHRYTLSYPWPMAHGSRGTAGMPLHVKTWWRE